MSRLKYRAIEASNGGWYVVIEDDQGFYASKNIRPKQSEESAKLEAKMRNEKLEERRRRL